MPDTIERSSQFDKTPTGWAELWFIEMKAADADQKRWQERGGKVERRFLDDREGEQKGRGDTRVNLFTANVQTLRALLYGKTPNVDVKRRFSDPGDDQARLAGEILQRMLNMDIERDDDTYAEALENALSDRLLPGLGVVRCRYEAEFGEEEVPPKLHPQTGAELAPGYKQQIKKSEDVEVDYVHWRDFKWSPARTWDEVRWIAFRCPMTKDALAKRFGEELLKEIPMNARGVGKPSTDPDDGEKNHPWSRAEVWEIWSKEHRKTFWWVEGCMKILDEKDDALGLEGFWPVPRPMFANLTTKKLIPTPDFTLAQDIYDEVDYVSTRITLLERAVAARGVYDKNSTEIKRLFNESMENDLIPVDGFAMFKEKGGLQAVVDWLPVEAFVQALDVLRGYRSELMQLLYQVTGMSDIMRGQSQSGATATAEALKAKFASTRVQEFQNEFARFASDCQKIKAEIISKHFDVETIAERSNVQYMTGSDPQKAMEAIQLIKSSIYQYRVEVKPESVAMADMSAVKQERSEFLLAVSQFLQSSQPIVAGAPWAGPFLLQILQWAMAGFRGGATIEGVLDQMVTQAQQALIQSQQNPQPNPEMMKVQAEMQADQQKMQMDMQAKQADMAHQQQKAQMEMQIKQVEMQMKKQEMQMDLMAKAFGFQMEQKKLQMGMEVAQQKAQTDIQTTQMKGEISARQAESEIQMDAKKMALEDQKGSMEHERAIADHEMSMEQADAQHKQKLKMVKEAEKAAPKKGGDK
jgi:hypothetical protein